jgi:hypothetical protein
MIKELKLPDELTQATNAKELMRIWIADDQQSVVFDDVFWTDPAAWGLLLVDLIHHIANAYAHSNNQNFEVAFERIKVGLEAEINFPTS